MAEEIKRAGDGAAGLVPAPAGVMYSSFGERYVAEAVRSARSSLSRHALPHLLFAGGGDVDDPPAGLSIVGFEPTSSDPFVDKIANMRRSPFERTLYLDSDTFVVDDISDVLAVLDTYDMALAHAPAYRGLSDPEVPRAFAEFNTGVVAWRASERVSEFMRSWEETYRAWQVEDVLSGPYGDPHPSRSGMRDQPSFRRCAWQHGVRIYVLPPEYNLRLGYLTTFVDRVHVIHGRFGDYEMLAERMNRKPTPRTFPTPRPVSTFRRKITKRLRRSIEARSLVPLTRRRYPPLK